VIKQKKLRERKIKLGEKDVERLPLGSIYPHYEFHLPPS
jgi:hypothetical protein